MPYSERQISVSCACAVGMWVLTAAFILAGTVVGITRPTETGLAVALSLFSQGLACSAAAAAVSVRAMVRQQSRLIREAFDFGREAGPPMRRVH